MVRAVSTELDEWSKFTLTKVSKPSFCEHDSVHTGYPRYIAHLCILPKWRSNLKTS